MNIAGLQDGELEIRAVHRFLVRPHARVVHQRRRGVVHTADDKPPDPGCLPGRDDPGTQRRRVGRKRRNDEEHAVDPIESSAHAGRITQVAHHGLISPGIPHPILFRRVVHKRPHLHASGYQAGTTSPANCPVAPQASTRTHQPPSSPNG